MKSSLTQQEKDAWIMELRNNNNVQIFDSLFNIEEESKKICERTCMCALGAAIKGADKFHNFNTNYDSFRFIRDKLCSITDDDLYERIPYMNDFERKSFAEIADWIEENVEVVS